MKGFYHTTLFLGLVSLLVLADSAYGQYTRISGKVVDAANAQPIPFANVHFKDSVVGVTTGMDGKFVIATTRPGDSLTVSFMGYLSKTVKVQKGKTQVINFALSLNDIYLREVEILPEENLVDVIMKRVVKNKDLNDPRGIEYYQCDGYSKIQFDINNITDKFRQRKVFKPFEFVFDYVDTSELNGKAYLPVFLSETVSEIYYRKSPPTRKEIIMGNKVSGVKNKSITQFLGSLYQNVNIYQNYITLFEKNFISPISNNCLSTYDYFLEDTVFLNGSDCFQIRFQPKRKQELTFFGRIWIRDSSYAVQQVDIRIAQDANLNFINDVAIQQEYDKVDNKYWIPVRDYLLIDFNPVEETKKLFGLFGHRTSTYRNFVFNEPRDREFYNTPTSVIIDKNAYNKGEEFWTDMREDSLSREEKQIYTMVDSIKKVPVFHTWEDAVYLITSGYLIKGKWEFGPLYKSISFNAIEGVRLRFGGRTSNKFSKRLMLEGHVAFGTLDQNFKYGLGFTYMLAKNPRRSLGASFLYDMEQLGQAQDAFAQDNFFASFFRRSPANKLNMVREFSGFYEHEWFPGFSNTIRLIHRDIYPIGDTRFIINEGGDIIVMHSLVSSEIQLQTRFAYKERYLYGEFERTSLGTTYPVVEILYGYGIPNFLGGEYEYTRLQVKVRQWFNVFSIGWSKYIIEYGKIWGALPYPMLKLHEGNETFLYYENASNLMNYYEYVSDQYISLYYSHHFDGLFFNHVPLLRKLKWREVIQGRAVWGTLTQANADYSKFPDGLSSLTRPYYEAGVGIENIFRIGRIDAIWRLSDLDNPGAPRFRIFVSLQFSF
jgi:hypothetical protein